MRTARSSGKGSMPEASDANPSFLKLAVTDETRKADVLSNLLHTVRFRSTIFGTSHLTSPWGISIAQKNLACFLIILKGRCYLTIQGVGTPIPLKEHEVVLLPQGHAHVIRDALGSPVTPLDQLLSADKLEKNGDLHYGGGGDLTITMCGGFQSDHPSINPILNGLPPFLHIQPDDEKDWSSLILTLQSLVTEAPSGAAGRDVIMARLSDILFVQILRASYLQTTPENPGLWSALTDQNISGALTLIHRDPERHWSVGELAREVGMSRTAFAVKFTALAGDSPARYMTRARITRAINYLRDSNITIQEIAKNVGYDSESALSRAFRRLVGVSPGLFRRERPKGSGPGSLPSETDLRRLR
jgi:AraC family transcriptional regulator, alkane utilization regulator